MDCKFFIFVLLCFLSSVTSQLLQTDAYDYCDPKLKLCPVPSDHTMCKYPTAELSPRCTKSIHEPLSPVEKERILYWHNKFRSYVANGTEKNKVRKLPTAANMRQMYWDDELETIAARWAAQCVSTTGPVVYDKCRNTKRFQVSQNVGTRRVNGTIIDKQAPQIVITWYKENKDFDPSLVDKFVAAEEKVSLRQFSNLLWANTYAVGCARVIFQENPPLVDEDSKPNSVWTTERLVCNYGPGGNEVGKPIYKRGVPCGSCPGGTECSHVFPGLCAVQVTAAPKAEVTPEEAKEKVKESTKEKESSATEKGPEASAGGPGSSEQEEKGQKQEKGGECEGPSCRKKVQNNSKSRFDDVFKLKPAAHKTRREVGLSVPGHEHDSFNIEKRKWTLNENEVGRVKWNRKRLKDGETCKCFIPLENGSGSLRWGRTPTVFLYFSTLLTLFCIIY